GAGTGVRSRPAASPPAGPRRFRQPSPPGRSASLPGQPTAELARASPLTGGGVPRAELSSTRSPPRTPAGSPGSPGPGLSGPGSVRVPSRAILSACSNRVSALTSWRPTAAALSMIARLICWSMTMTRTAMARATGSAATVHHPAYRRLDFIHHAALPRGLGFGHLDQPPRDVPPPGLLRPVRLPGQHIPAIIGLVNRVPAPL